MTSKSSENRWAKQGIQKDIKKARPTTRLEFSKRAARVRNPNKGETPRGSWAGGFLAVGTHFGAPEPFQERSKNHSIC